jgi:peptidyl-prolyl cis-trans isomerase D
MLEVIRQNRNVFSAIFVISAVGMVVSMFGSDMGRGGGFSLLAGGSAASVEGKEISSRELTDRLGRRLQDAERMLNEQLKSMGGGAENRKFFEQLIRSQVTPESVLGELIRERFMETTADAAGVIAPKQAILEMIRGEKAFQKDGRFDPLTYKQLVPEPGPFEKQVALQAKMQLFSQAFSDGLGVVSPEEKTLEQGVRAKRVFEIVQVQPRNFPEPKSVSAEEASAFAADAANLPKLQAYYDRNISQFQSDEQVHARHILIKSDAGEKKAQEILAEIQAGKTTWEAAAKQHSEDKSNSEKGGDLGFFGRGMMDPAFEKAAFDLKAKNEYAKPVKSSFGWHLIQLVDRKPATKKSLDEVKAAIAAPALLEIKRTEAARKWVDGVAASGKVPSEAELKKLGLTWAKQNPWAPIDGPLGSLGNVDAHLKALLALDKANPLLKSSLNVGDNIALVRWLETQPAEYTANDKTEAAFQWYLQARYEGLEKNKKIRRSESTLRKLSEQMQPRT